MVEAPKPDRSQHRNQTESQNERVRNFVNLPREDYQNKSWPSRLSAGYEADNLILEKTITLTNPQKKSKAKLRAGVLKKKLITLLCKYGSLWAVHFVDFTHQIWSRFLCCERRQDELQ